MVTSNLPFNQGTEILGSERLTGASLDRLTHHVHVLEMNGESYRLKKANRPRPAKLALSCTTLPDSRSCGRLSASGL
jgi:IstB-like ATP binding protein